MWKSEKEMRRYYKINVRKLAVRMEANEDVSGSCAIPDFGVSGVQPSGSATRVGYSIRTVSRRDSCFRYSPRVYM
jgi:hypothetical protein